MDRRFHCPINAVRFRQRVQRTLNYTAGGLCAAALVALLFPYVAVAITLASILVGSVGSYSLSTAARLIDRHYRLKDRILTTIALLRRTNHTPMEQLQIDDTAEHIATVKPKAVYPLRLPKMFWIAVAVFAFNVIGMAIIHSRSHQPEDVESVIFTALDEKSAAQLEEIIAKAEELAQTHAGEPILRNLFDQLEVLTLRLESSADVREALKALSEMEEAIQSALDSLKLETMDDLLQDLAKTLELAEKTTPISRALEKGDYSQAALELKRLDAEMLESLSQPERSAMSEQMQIIAEKAEQKNQQTLQEAAQQMSDALKDDDGESAKSATDSLANTVERHGIRKSIGENLAQQQMALAMMKADNGLAMSGGQQTEKSDTASETWGRGSAGNPNTGQETQLDGTRQQEMLTGTMTEQGESQMETIDSQETTDESQGQRQYQEQFLDYQKQAEAVLDTEPIPLGQRRVIRQYFEAIRPSAE